MGQHDRARPGWRDDRAVVGFVLSRLGDPRLDRRILSVGRRRGGPRGPPAAAMNSGGVLLEVEDYSGAFRAANGDPSPVLHHVSFQLRTRAITAIVGETGSGKS